MAVSVTPAKPLPTAATPSDAGGGGPFGAPLPGQAGVNGAYGPGDNYIAGASQLKRNALIVTILSIALSAVMVAV
ncbi:hypothetical protein BDN72DRAFT_830241 [Pluteus cervinus]|uniref:Uncharacterized protein n=1 Tax=Pluteus cervinus TaxID=181527 RepID=A0ACD3BHN1_9AGAR|nr:hypothetical protein BDN72DRAFT_830241 [Pluteus cervinus]